MSVVLRLKRMGTKKKPFYRIVVMTKTEKRDGRAIEELGHYDPKKGKEAVELNKERVDYWIGCGAKPSDTVKDIIKRVTG